MKVAIANPPWPGKGYGARTNVRWPHRRGDKCLAFPIYLAYASSLLKREGFDVFAVDAVEKELGIFNFVAMLKAHNPDVVLLEISTPSLGYDLETAALVKETMPKAKLAVCGPHVTYFHKRLLEDYRFIDFCVRGEFDTTMLALCNALKSRKSLGSVKGISWRDGNKVVANQEGALNEELDKLPYPDRDSFKIEDYQQAFYGGKKTALMISSRGCPFQCTFCLWPNTVAGRRYRARPAGDVVDEIEHLIKEHKIDEVFFDDDTFALDKKRVMEICAEINKRGIKIKWLCMGRVNTVDEEMLKAMKNAGCYQIFYGFESGSEKILKSIRKGITKKEMIRAVRLTQKCGIVVAGSFVFGMPEEDMSTVNETLDFAKRLKADWVQFTLAAPFPGTEFYSQAKELNLLEIDSWEDLDGTHGPIVRTLHLTRKQLQGVIRRAYLEYYTSPGVIAANLKKAVKERSMGRVLRGAASVFSRIVYYKK